MAGNNVQQLLQALLSTDEDKDTKSRGKNETLTQDLRINYRGGG